MGEVGTNSSENPNVDLKMNGVNGNCEDEPMDVDTQETSQVSHEITAKKLAVDTKDSGDDKSVANKSDNVTKDSDVSKLDAIAECEEKDSENAGNLSEINRNAQENGNGDKLDSIKEQHSDSDDNSQDTTKNNNVATDKQNESRESNNDQENSRDSCLLLEDKENASNKCDDIEMVELNSKEKPSQQRSDNVEKGNSDKTSNGKEANEEKDSEIQILAEVEEVHAISDSEDEISEETENEENPLKDADDAMEVDGKKSNGVLNDDDKPVSIASDSDVEDDCTSNSKVNNIDDEIHEILSDKEEDCVVIEDDKRSDGDQLSPRRSVRARKSVVTVRDFSAFDDDIEEIIEDPLQQPPAKRLKPNLPMSVPHQITIQDARSLAADPLNTARGHSTSSTVQALQKQNVSVVPVGVPAQGMYPANMRTSGGSVGATISPLPKATSTTLAGLPTLINAPLLSALTDDMFVLEAPSFIVPYIYEKPPTTDLKEIVDKMGLEIEEQRKKDGVKEEKEEKEEDVLNLEAKEESKESEKDGEETAKKDERKKKRSSRKNADDSWDESDTSTDDEASDNEERTKVLIKEVKEDLESIKTHIINRDITKDQASSDQKKDSNNYFDSPLGKFFMDIGINLVQEHVQTDLLRQQKRKLNREGVQASPSIQVAINSLMKNLELSKGTNDVFKFESKRCEYCNFKSESSLVMAHHYETPHMKGNLYKCNFCSYEIRTAYDILFHMKNIHNIQARLEKAASLHQCPNCLFEDNGRSKLARHALVCSKKFRPEVNLSPPVDWEPPAKIPRIKPRHGLVGTANAYQAMAAQAQRAATAAALQKQNAANAALLRNRGRPQQPIIKAPVIQSVVKPNQQMRPQMAGGMVLPNNFQFTNSGQFIQVSGAGLPLLPNAHSSLIMQPTTSSKTTKSSQQPSISITALPRQHSGNVGSNSMGQAGGVLPKPPGAGNMKPGQGPQSGKTSFVICEICDGYIKDLDQLRNHMQWMHKVKIHPKMIYNRPPLNCQKCQFRFFTDQGLERHLLGSHGLVTSSMQDLANKGRDAGRCPVCARLYQWKLLNHVSREHNMTLKPAHLSYKCTVCTATFGMYKQFENHVYSAHSTVAKKAMDNKKNSSAGGSSSSSSSSATSLSKIVSGITGGNLLPNAGDSLLKPLKINDEITIIPQSTSRNNRTIEIESHVID